MSLFKRILFFLKKTFENVFKSKPKKNDEINSSSVITIAGATTKEQFTLDIKRFVFAKVEGNYTDIYITKTDNTYERIIIRIPLKELKNQLIQYNSAICHTHRSYLVNTYFVSSVKGNAQGYSIGLFGDKLKAFVARSKIEEFNKSLIKE